MHNNEPSFQVGGNRSMEMRLQICSQDAVDVAQYLRVTWENTPSLSAA